VKRGGRKNRNSGGVALVAKGEKINNPPKCNLMGKNELTFGRLERGK